MERDKAIEVELILDNVKNYGNKFYYYDSKFHDIVCAFRSYYHKKGCEGKANYLINRGYYIIVCDNHLELVGGGLETI